MQQNQQDAWLIVYFYSFHSLAVRAKLPVKLPRLRKIRILNKNFQ